MDRDLVAVAQHGDRDAYVDLIRSRADRLFALGLCHVLVNEKLYDTKFLKKDTNAPYLVGPDGYFVRNAQGKVYVWDAAEDKAKLHSELKRRLTAQFLQREFEKAMDKMTSEDSQPSNGKPEDSKAAKEAFLRAQLLALDTNQDGELSADEAAPGIEYTLPFMKRFGEIGFD